MNLQVFLLLLTFHLHFIVVGEHTWENLRAFKGGEACITSVSYTRDKNFMRGSRCRQSVGGLRYSSWWTSFLVVLYTIPVTVPCQHD